MYALFDNCNSLHTNAYDEALTTPTEESVRRAVAIQLIINRELGLNKIQNPWQGSYAIEALTDLVEEAVYKEFESIAERGGVLGAMETMYQRGKIQEESMHYETRKHDGSLPIVGVNTFLNDNGDGEHAVAPLFRASDEEQRAQVDAVHAFQARHAPKRRPKHCSGCSSRGARAATCSPSCWRPCRSARSARSPARCTKSAANTAATCSRARSLPVQRPANPSISAIAALARAML